MTDLRPLWNFDDPAGSEQRFRAAADVAEGAERLVLLTQVARALGLQERYDDDMVKITAQAAALALANPTGIAIPGVGLVIRIKDNGTARAITYGTQYRAVGVTLPNTTVINKTLYLGMIYNSDDTKWDVTAVAQE